MNTRSSPRKEIVGIKKEKNNKNGSSSITLLKQEKKLEHPHINDANKAIDSDGTEHPLREIKKEKRPKSVTFIPRPIKSEPQSDVEEDVIGKIRKRKNVSSLLNITSSNLFPMQEQVLSSTLKIKQEPQSENESPIRKKAKKPTVKTKSLETMENDLFNSILQ